MKVRKWIGNLKELVGARVKEVSDWRVILEKNGEEYEIVVGSDNGIAWLEAYKYVKAPDYIGQFDTEEEFLV